MKLATRTAPRRAWRAMAVALFAALVLAFPASDRLSANANADSDPPGDLGLVFAALPCNLPPGFDPSRGGALVVDVQPGSPADRADVREGDIVLKFDMQPVASAAELPGRIRRLGAGRLASMVVWRNGSEVYTGLMTLAERRQPFADRGFDDRPTKEIERLKDDVRDLERKVRDLTVRLERLEVAERAGTGH